MARITKMRFHNASGSGPSNPPAFVSGTPFTWCPETTGNEIGLRPLGGHTSVHRPDSLSSDFARARTSAVDAEAVKTFLDKKKPLDSQAGPRCLGSNEQCGPPGVSTSTEPHPAETTKTDEADDDEADSRPICWEMLGVFGLLRHQDFKGITALGYAIGANRIAVVKLLLLG